MELLDTIVRIGRSLKDCPSQYIYKGISQDNIHDVHNIYIYYIIPKLDVNSNN